MEEILVTKVTTAFVSDDTKDVESSFGVLVHSREHISVPDVTTVHSSDNLLVSKENTKVMTETVDSVKSDTISNLMDEKNVSDDEVDSPLADLLIAGKRSFDGVGVLCDAILAKNKMLRQRNARRKRIASALGGLFMAIVTLAIALNNFNNHCIHGDCVKLTAEMLHNVSLSHSKNISSFTVFNKSQSAHNTKWIETTQQLTYD